MMKLELDEIITRCEEIAKDLNKRACTLYESQDYEKSKDCIWRAADYKQLAEQFAEWREDLKKYSETNWIPVSERLPEEGEPILFSTKTGRVYEGAYFDLSDNRQWYAYKDENYAWNNVVTAWMPLPEPYRESEEE